VVGALLSISRVDGEQLSTWLISLRQFGWLGTIACRSTDTLTASTRSQPHRERDCSGWGSQTWARAWFYLAWALTHSRQASSARTLWGSAANYGTTQPSSPTCSSPPPSSPRAWSAPLSPSLLGSSVFALKSMQYRGGMSIGAENSVKPEMLAGNAL